MYLIVSTSLYVSLMIPYLAYSCRAAYVQSIAYVRIVVYSNRI